MCCTPNRQKASVHNIRNTTNQFSNGQEEKRRGERHTEGCKTPGKELTK